MTTTRWLTGRHGLAVLSLIAATVMLAGVSECEEVGVACSFDSECSDGRACVDTLCREPCASGQDCSGAQRCEVVVRDKVDDTVQVCLPRANEEQDSGGNLECEQSGNCCVEDEPCRRALDDEDAYCGYDQRCVIPERRIGIRLAAALSEGREGTEGVDGPDIGAAFAVDARTQRVVGFGQVVDAPWQRGLLEAAGRVLDGEPPRVDDAGRCISGELGEDTFALGTAEAGVILEFVGERGEVVALTPSMEIVIVSWGKNCDAEIAREEALLVDLCEFTERSFDPAVDCLVSLVDSEPVAGYVSISLDGQL